jgi:hexosaminidase
MHNKYFASEHPELAILPLPASVISSNEEDFLLTTETVIVTGAWTHATGLLLADMLAPSLGFLLPVQAGIPSAAPAIVLSIDPELAHLGKEGYVLQVTSQRIVLRGADPSGVFYATQTLRQLLPADIFSPLPIKRIWNVPAVLIEDTPRFPWRGFLLDTARHFIPKPSILKLIDLLALHKINVLHLHLTDDQGWRVEIKKYPKLTEVGAYRKGTLIGHARNPQWFDETPYGGFYTQHDLREIVEYAAVRAITVVPEIDMPGHAQAAIASYAELGVTGKQIEVATGWGIYPSLYNPTDKTIQFLQDVLAEVMTIFPGPYIHVGGDEAIKNQWQASSSVQARIRELRLKDEEDLQRWFLTQMGTFLAQNGRRLVGWDEMLDGGLPPDSILMSWRGIKGGILAAQAQHDVVMSPYSHLYLDSYQSNDPTEPLAIGRYVPLERVYSFDPVPGVLTGEQANHILGAQCALWSEYISTAEHLEYMAFPRAIALAEVAWTPQKRRDFSDFRRRLALHETCLTALAVNFRPVARLHQEHAFPTREATLPIVAD